MISVQYLSKRYVDQVIFDNISFNLSPRERIGLVGRNGHGKTTLFRMLTGQEQYEEGIIAIPKNYRIGYLSQHINFTRPTVLEEGCCGLPDDQLADDWRVKSVLSGLGFSENDFDRNPAEFSGGYQIRLNLTKVLVSSPNLLLLDEPTNFLDIVSIRWLINFLNNWKNEILIISHDRSFMDSVATHIMGIHRHNIRKIKGTTQDYYDQVSKEEEIHEKQRLNEDKKRKQAENFINSFRAKARHASLVQSRIKSLEKQKVLKKLEMITTLSFSFNAAPFPAKYILEAQDVSFSYSDKPLIDHVSFNVESGDKICIIGKNGKGKTTLLKLLAGILSPLEGKMRSHPQTKIGYYEQANTATLNENLTVEEEISSGVANIERKRVRDICGAMLFSGDNALKKIGVLSGGEKCRTLLGKLLVMPANLLLLDEPTHHLDMQSCEAMMDAIVGFSGTVLMVTHNEHIIHRIANKLIVFHHDRIFFFHGTYSQFLEQIGWDDQESITLKKKSSKQEEKQPKNFNKKDIRKVRAEFVARRSKTLNPYERKIKELEDGIEKLEHQFHNDTQALIKASHDQDGATISSLSKSMKPIRAQIDSLYNELDKVNEEYERHKLMFEEEERCITIT